MRNLKYPFIFTVGGLSYGVFELIYRARTHWTMLIVGGLCVTFLYILATKSVAPAWKKWITAGVVITTIEFYAGVAVNIFLKWHVWDYSNLSINLLGQISPHFSILWVALSIPSLKLLKAADDKFYAVRRYD